MRRRRRPPRRWTSTSARATSPRRRGRGRWRRRARRRPVRPRRAGARARAPASASVGRRRGRAGTRRRGMDDGRRMYDDIGRRVKLSAPSVTRRMDRLRAAGGAGGIHGAGRPRDAGVEYGADGAVLPGGADAGGGGADAARPLGRRWFIPASAIEGGSSIHLGGPKYSELEIEPGGSLTELIYGEATTPSRLIERRGSAGAGEPGWTVNSVALPEWVRIPPPPPQAPPPDPSAPLKFQRTRISSGHQITIPSTLVPA